MGGGLERVPHNFGALPAELSSWESSRAVVIPVPYDATSTYLSGSRHGPAAIISASTNMELYDEELEIETARIGIHTEDALDQVASSPEGMVDAVEQAVGEVAGAGKLPVVLGGEHTVTIGALRAVAARHPKMSILQFDAHADLRDSYQGSRFSHACVGRRAAEIGDLVQVGVRSLSVEEADFRIESAVPNISSADILEERLRAEEVISSLGKDLYITIDLDVFDPSVMPSTGAPEPGGLGWYDVIALLAKACEGRNIIGFDVVELCPMPGNHAPDFLAAKLVYRILGYVFVDELQRGRI